MRSIFSRGDHKRQDSNGSKPTHLRVLMHKRCLSPLSLDDEGRRYSYHKLPPQFFKLSVLKLDGSVFDVNVCRNATVGELKEAVEEVFTSSPKDGRSSISWFHVWGHFCLSYQGQKLLNDKTAIRNLGIKDGDQLQFIRHMSMNYSNSKRRLKNENAANKPYPALFVQEEIEQQSTLHQNSEKKEDEQQGEEEEEVPEIAEFKLAHFLRGWLTYSRSWGGSSKRSPTQSSRPSRFSLPLLGSGPKMIELQG